MANVSTTPRRVSFAARLEAWFAAWLKALREVKAQAELTNKLKGVDDHLLRDMGLTWTGRRYEQLSATKMNAFKGRTPSARKQRTASDQIGLPARRRTFWRHSALRSVSALPMRAIGLIAGSTTTFVPIGTRL